MFDPSSCRRGAGFFVISMLALASVPRASEAATTSCNIPQACALFTNASGPGIAGTSAKNEGMLGTTTFAGTSTSNRTYGVEGVDGSTNKSTYNVGVYGTSPYGFGIYGTSPNGSGVYGTTTSGYGVRATASSGTAISGTSSTGNGILGQTSATSTSTLHAGVTGKDATTNEGLNNGVVGTTSNGGYGVEGLAGDDAHGGVFGQATNAAGVTGRSSSGYGVIGTSTSGGGFYGLGVVGIHATGSSVGAEAFSTSGTGLTSHSNSGAGISTTSDSGDGIDATTGGSFGAEIVDTNGSGTAVDARGTYIAVSGRSDSYPLLLTNAAGSDVFYVTGAGTVYAHGSYQTFVATRNGQGSTAFTTRSTTPNVEDVGGARLVDGTATVRFDAAFAASIDSHATYRVFLTPNGDTRGLYVAMKTPAGFVVRETQGGRGTVDFDYRIVAVAPGRTQERMALVDTARASAPKAASVTRTVDAVPVLGEPTVRGRAIR